MLEDHGRHEGNNIGTIIGAVFLSRIQFEFPDTFLFQLVLPFAYSFVRFISFRFVSFRFVSFRVVSFLFVPFNFVPFRSCMLARRLVA